MPQAQRDTLIAIVGPTASGKTSLAVELALTLGGEVISADSRQVYRGLNIGTEKASKKEMCGVPHHCIDIASPKRAYSVEQWRRVAEKAIRTIVRHGNVPIVAGGTGFYVDALVDGTRFPKVKPHATLRRSLARKSTRELLAQLRQLDPTRARTIEQRNPRRLIRAIEIATAIGKVPMIEHQNPQYDVHWIGLHPDKEVLRARIRAQLEASLHRGLLAETRALLVSLGPTSKRIDALGLEYRIAASYIRGDITKETMHELMVRELTRYARKQMVWFKRNDAIHWYKNAKDACDPNCRS